MSILKKISSQPKYYMTFLKTSNKTKLVFYVLISIIISTLKESIFSDVSPSPTYLEKLLLSLYLMISITLFMSITGKFMPFITPSDLQL
jgi:hypothetical protein